MSSDSSSPEISDSKTKKKLFNWHNTSVKKVDFGNPWRVVLNVFVIFVISQLLAAFITVLLIHLTGRPSSALDNSPVFQFVYVFLAEGLAVGSVLLILNRRKLAPASIGLGRKPNLGDLGHGLIGFGVFYGLIILGSIILSLVFPDFNKGTQDVGFNNLDGWLPGVIAFVALVILPPLGEEPLIRGYLYSGLRSKMKFVPAMLITSILFGAAHLEGGTTTSLLWAAGVNTFILSLVLVYLREKSGALYAGILVHMLNNAIAFGVHFHGIVF
jgi:membrane protease YdiL (CAAX protease family)